MLVTPQFVAIVGLLLKGASALDLAQYPGDICADNTYTICRDARSLQCCRRIGSGFRFSSASCNNAQVGTWRHVVYRGGTQSDQCNGQKREKLCAPNSCIRSGAFTGHSWYKPAKRDVLPDFGPEECAAEANTEAKSCAETIEPDLIVINGRVFEVNGTTISQDQKDRLWGLFDEHSSLLEVDEGSIVARAFSVPREFDQFETTYKL